MELVPRLQAIVRRRLQVADAAVPLEYLIGDYRFRFHYRELLHGSEAVFFSEREAELLLVCHKNELLPRNLALLRLWGGGNRAGARSMEFLSQNSGNISMPIRSLRSSTSGERAICFGTKRSAD